jgi:hypothetical protein
MKITAKTRVSEILKEHGDIAGIMEIFGVKRVGGYGLRKFLTQFISVRIAAFVHQVPLKDFISMLSRAVEKAEQIS